MSAILTAGKTTSTTNTAFVFRIEVDLCWTDVGVSALRTASTQARIHGDRMYDVAAIAKISRHCIFIFIYVWLYLVLLNCLIIYLLLHISSTHRIHTICKRYKCTRMRSLVPVLRMMLNYRPGSLGRG